MWGNKSPLIDAIQAHEMLICASANQSTLVVVEYDKNRFHSDEEKFSYVFVIGKSRKINPQKTIATKDDSWPNSTGKKTNIRHVKAAAGLFVNQWRSTNWCDFDDATLGLSGCKLIKDDHHLPCLLDVFPSKKEWPWTIKAIKFDYRKVWTQ